MRNDKLAGNANKLVGGPDSLVHQARKLDIEAVGAGTGHDQVGIGNVILEVGRGDVLAIPA